MMSFISYLTNHCEIQESFAPFFHIKTVDRDGTNMNQKSAEMSQTTVNQFFVARKSSFSVQPSKKRKVDSNDIEINSKPLTAEKKQTRSKKSSRPRQHHQSRRKIAKQLTSSIESNNKASQPVTPTKLLDCKIYHKSPLGKLEVNDVINDQAKSILHSRGSAILKASLTQKSSSSPAKVSEVLLSMSPQKKTENISLDIINSNGKSLGSSVKSAEKHCNTEIDKDLLKRRDALRKKYSNLLNEELSVQQTPLSVSTETKNESSSDSNDDKKYRMRNKYKHLLAKDGVASTSSKSSDDHSQRLSPQKAHEKYKHLTEKTSTALFHLPQKYKLLLEMFRSVDSILYLLQQRSEVCTFDRLKKSVQSMCGREFNLNHIAAMKTIYPNGFIFRQEKGLYTANGKSNNHQLTVEANFKDLQLSTSSLRNSSTILISRRLKFENALVERTKIYHQKFLKKLNVRIEDCEIHRWHPHFKLEAVPEIELSALPKPPLTKSFTSASEVLFRNPNCLPSKIENALQKASNCTQVENSNAPVNTLTDIPKEQKSSSSTITKNTKLKGVSSDLLERIRQKEQRKLELAMTRDPKQEIRLSRMERLPEISRILKSYFTTEKKAAITLEDCVQKLSESYSSDVQSSKLEEHLKLLAELVPKWIRIVPVRKCLFVKLTKNYDINNVINTLDDHKKREANT